MPECQVSGSMVSEGATHHRSFSIRRAILVCYASGLFFATHNPLVHAQSAEEMHWWDGLLWGLVRFGHSLRLDRPDKWFHLAAFLVLGLLAFWAASSHRGRAVSAKSRHWMTGGWMTVLGLLFWGWLDEATQPFFGRHFDWNDCLANAVGIFLAAMVATLLYLLRRFWHLIRNDRAPVV
jgi:VanZ family protein